MHIMQIAKSDNMDVFIVAYNVTFSDPDTGSVIYLAPFSTCGEDTCETDITPPTGSLAQVCPSSTITVTTDNGLGESGPTTIGMCWIVNQEKIFTKLPSAFNWKILLSCIRAL